MEGVKMARDSILHPLMIRIDDTIYRLEYDYCSHSTVVILVGHHIDDACDLGDLPNLVPNTECCVFSHFLDMLAYIKLREKGSGVCSTLDSCDYVILKQSSVLPVIYEMLKHYEAVHGYLRKNPMNKVVNDYLRDLLPGIYSTRINRYGKATSLIEYWMERYKVMEF